MAGQIIKRGYDVWLIRVFKGRNALGKREYKNKTVHGPKKLADKVLRDMLAKRDAGKLTDHPPQPFSDVIDEWLRIYAKKEVSERTYYNYVSMLEVHIRPGLQTKFIEDIDKKDIQNLYDGISAKGLSARSLKHIHTLLNQIMEWAIEREYIEDNPCGKTSRDKVRKREVGYFNQGETRQFLATAKEDPFHPLFHFAIVTGCRPEEYLAISWRDINWESKLVFIRRALVKKRGGGFELLQTKTDGSRRNIPLTDELVDDLRAHRHRQLEHRMKKGAEYIDNDLVFATRDGTPIEMSNLSRRHFIPIRDNAKVPKITLYGLRHTMATLLLEEGTHIKIVSERLGHSTTRLTLDTYSHVIPGMQENATEQMGEVLKKRA